MRPRWPFNREPPPGLLGDDGEEIQDEVELYLELRTRELMETGLEPAEARRQAEVRFGDRANIEARMRREARRGNQGEGEGMTISWMWRDVRYALRGFRRDLGFTLVAVMTLGVALAGNTAIFSVLDASILQALPFPEDDGLVFVRGYHVNDGQRAFRMASIPEFRDWRERARTLSPMVPVDGTTLTLGGDDRPERVQAEAVGAGYFQLLQASAVLGRTFTAEEAETPDGYPLVVLSHRLWQDRFGGEVSVLGLRLDLDGRPYSVLGVMGPDFQPVGLDDVQLWIPLGMYGENVFESRGSRFLPVAARLAPGFTMAQAQDELDAIALDLQVAHPQLQEGRGAELQSFRAGYLGTTGDYLWILSGAGVLLLLIASANVANLLLVRAHGRTRELTVRRALGAPDARIASQLVVESLVLAALGGALGLVLAAAGLEALLPAVPEGVLPAYANPAISTRVFLTTLATLALVGLAVGFLPALSSARRDLATALRAGGRGAASGSGGTARHAFVVAQVALAILVLIGAGLLTRSFRAQLAVDPGIDVEGIYVIRVEAPAERYPDAESLRIFASQVIQSVASVPSVEEVTVSSDFPFRGRSSGSYIVRPDDPEELIRYHRHSVSPGYFQSLGVEFLAGRSFTDADDAGARGVAVVTEVMVRRVFPELDDPASAVGRTIFIGPPSDPDNEAQIVGVVENVRYRNLTQDFMADANSPDVFFSFLQIPPRTYEVAVRSGRSLGDLLPGIREAVASVDPTVPLFFPGSLVEAYRAQTATPRFAAFLMGLFSLLAVTLACIGVYGVLAFSVAERAREIAVRRALGAQASSVAGRIIRDGLRVGLIGMALGGLGAWFGGRLLRDLLFQVRPADPVTYLAAGVGVFFLVLAAAAVPAWRATRRDPAEALAAE